MSNLLTILSYDSRIIKILLGDKNKSLFCKKYPLIYSYKHTFKGGKFEYQSAIDIALSANQIRVISLIIDYLTNYQNSYIFSYLFKNNFIKLIKIGVPVSNLLNSDIFCHNFELRNWPEIHTSDKKSIASYNESIFLLGQKYHEIFPLYRDNEQLKKYL